MYHFYALILMMIIITGWGMLILLINSKAPTELTHGYGGSNGGMPFLVGRAGIACELICDLQAMP